MTTRIASPIDRSRPVLTGGGGALLEWLIGLATGVTAALAAFAWKRPQTAGESHAAGESGESDEGATKSPDEPPVGSNS